MDTQQLKLNGHLITVERAVTLAQQQHGLADRSSLAPDRGMLFVYSEPLIPTFWMKGMQFPIDIIWLSKGQVLSVESDIKPNDGVQTYHPQAEVDAVLELAAGQAANFGLQPGTTIAY